MYDPATIQELVHQVLSAAGDVRKINRVRIIVGEDSALKLNDIRSGFHNNVHDTIASDAVVELIEEKLEAQCQECGTDFKPHRKTTICPFCGSAELRYIAGQHLKLSTIEVVPKSIK